jgi:hypothetical protein
MADQSDVEATLATLIAGVLYPHGVNAASILGVTTRIYRGWPNATALDADLVAGRVNITVFPEPGTQRNTTRYPDHYQVTSTVAPELGILTQGNTATFFGIATAGQLAGLLVGADSVVHRTVAGDTPTLVAAVLAAKLRDATGRVVQQSGDSLTVPGAGFILGRVVADQPAIRETRRQQQGFRLSAWCPDPTLRDIVCAAIDTDLSDRRFIALPDGTGGALRFAASTVFDQSQNARLYRRDLLYSVDYATTITASLPTMLFGRVSLAPGSAGVLRTLTG